MSTKKEETRLRLLEAARELLVSNGFQHITLEDIANAAGVSRQAVYKSHFASKAELLLALVRHVHVTENLDELTRPYHEAKSGRKMFEEAIRTIVLIQTRVHDVARALHVAAYSDPEAAEAVQDRILVQRGALRAAIERAACEGALDPAWDVEQVLSCVSCLLSTESYESLVVKQGWSPEAVIGSIWSICHRSFLKHESPEC